MNATAAEILSLQPRYGTDRPADAVPASVEFVGPHGMINYFLWGVPAQSLLARPEVAELAGGIQSMKLLQSEEDRSWRLAMHGTNMDIPPLEYPIAQTEVTALLAKHGIGMPGLQQNDAPAAAPDEADDPNAPPF